MSELGELRVRRAVAIQCVKAAREAAGDPRAAEAEVRYQEQLNRIEARIRELEGQPPDIVVGLKTAVMFGKAQC